MSDVEALMVDSGRLWVSDNPEAAGGKARIDGFEDFGSFGFLAPQLDEERGVSGFADRLSVGEVGTEDQLYVTANHEGKQVVAVYSGVSGELLGSWSGANTVNKAFTERAGQHVGSLTGVAVDRSRNPATTGDVYVATHGFTVSPEFNVIDVFKGELGPVGEEPEVVATLRGTCSMIGTSCTGEEVVSFSEPLGVVVSGANGDVLVTDVTSEGPVVDVFEPRLNGPSLEYVYVRKLTRIPAGPFERISDVAVDGGDGEIYVADEFLHVVDQFTETGEYLGQITGTSGSNGLHTVKSVAVDPETHLVFVADDDPSAHTASVDAFGADLIIPDVETLAASAIRADQEGRIQVTLNGTANPDNAGNATCQFVWGTTEIFGQTIKCAEEVPEGGGHVAATLGEGLEPDTEYFFRLQASNTSGTNPGEPRQNRSFRTPGAGIHSESSSDVTSTSATLSAQIDPNGAPTSFYFQYTTAGSTAGCDASPGACLTAPAAPGKALELGSGNMPAQMHVQGLAPGTFYHYRVLAVSELEVEPEVTAPVTFVGSDRAFTTLGLSTGASPLDGRRWELVSPADKHGAVIFSLGRQPASLMSSASGNAVSYPLTSATENGVEGFANSVQAFSTRGSHGGWSSTDISVAHAQPTGSSIGVGSEYRAFSEDLCAAVVEPQGPFTSLTPNVFPPDSERTPYLRHNCTCTAEPTGCFEPIATGALGYADVPIGTNFGGREVGDVSFIGASRDLSHILVASTVQLTSTVTPPGVRELYEWSADKPASERLALVSKRDGGQPAAQEAEFGFEGPGVIARNAITDDGTRVFWTEKEGGLYLYDTAKELSVRLDAMQGGSGSGVASPVFQATSTDGSRVFFTDQQRLSADSGAQLNKPDLYVCEIIAEACVLRDLTPLTSGESAWVQGAMVGASEDGSWLYVVANGVLAGAAGEGARSGDCHPGIVPGGTTCNLYVLHRDGASWEAPRLVAVLSAQDFSDWSGNGTTVLDELTARVSPDGWWLAFMSEQSLTGYDNHDAVSDELDQEVFLYHAAVGGPGRLTCVSCDPSGARPDGVEYAKVRDGLIGGDRETFAPSQWLAGSVPGWTPYRLGKALYQSRFLSDSGRLFFNSSDGLVATDVNGNEDVYEFEPSEVGSCTNGSRSFVSIMGGCLGLVSSGRAAGESAFVDASEDGGDVFFLTGGRLASGDIDTALDLYDAHACSEAAPCSTEPEVPAACVTADSCRLPPSLQSSVFDVPASATFSGTGNLSPKPSVTAKPAAQTHAKKLAYAMRVCRKKHDRHRRKACELHAHKRFGVKVAARNRDFR